MKKVLLVSMTHNVTDLVKAAEPDLKGGSGEGGRA